MKTVRFARRSRDTQEEFLKDLRGQADRLASDGTDPGKQELGKLLQDLLQTSSN